MPLQGLGRRRFRLDPSCVLYLPFYELDGGLIRSKDANGHLTTVTGATWGIQGRTFNGISNYLTVPDSPNWNFGSGDFAEELWLKWTAVGNCVFTHQQADGNNRILWYMGGGGVIILFYVVNSTVAVISTSNAWSPVNGVWYHLVLTRVGNTLYMYANGVQLMSADVTGAVIPDIASVWELGASLLDSSGYINATIGEVRIYKGRGLTQIDVERNRLATKWRYS